MKRVQFQGSAQQAHAVVQEISLSSRFLGTRGRPDGWLGFVTWWWL